MRAEAEPMKNRNRTEIEPTSLDADTLRMLNFIISIFTEKSAFHGKYKANPNEILKEYRKNVRHQMTHGIVEENGRWSDITLQNVSLLACKVVACLSK